MRILVVEDEKSLNEVIVKRLEDEHYGVDWCYNGKDALDNILITEYDAIILDIMLPELNGYEVLKTMRSKNIDTPVLFLTAKDSIEDRVKGLDSGANDYLTKPFAFEELLARIRVMLRKDSNSSGNVFTVANLTVDTNSHSVFRDDIPIKLSKREFTILEYMIRNRGKILSKDKIEQHIWNYDYEGGSNVIEVYIRYLRKKIDADFSPKLIHNIYGVGYILKVEDE
ncbi:response regulator transcription factor [Pseudoleptotrichia goodfellowii]|uniref:Response regulator receiver domain protein n=1 Tax=Pseudoleptotrichia goodfellowii F0264 TaxID=596323 RepID=D0GPG6_9FUSO|nr:response regulator transcription factor [Pseudoleptotrichia goodfellowii]EEY34031.1 response regulator receiver domain protein [Pseudoleptotrichia goodfellowii F0264]MBF4805947.1 response regulator transcription factor [Pseudoleptotrichia goodfellowii]